MQPISSDQNDEGATFFVSGTNGRLAPDSNGLHSNVVDDFERVLDEHCETPVQCYRFLENGEVTSVFTEINTDGTATNKRRRVSFEHHRENVLNYVETSSTSDGYGVEFVLKRSTEVLPSDSEDERHPYKSPAIARTRTRRSRLGRKRRVLFRRKDDKELFRERLESHKTSLINLTDKLAGNSFVRSQHWYHDGRTFAFASAYIRNNESKKAVVALLWHTRTRPHRAVCVSFSLEKRTSTADSDEERLIANCSCCHLLSQSSGSERGCYHAQISLGDAEFTKVVASEIRRREASVEQGEDDFSIFGEPFVVEGHRGALKQLTVLLDQTASSRRTLASSWLFFMTFDLDLHLFCPVLKVKGKPFKCLLCRIPSSRRGTCEHEDCAKKACKTLRRQHGNGSGILSELVLSGDEASEELDDDEAPARNEYAEENDGGNRSVKPTQEYVPHVRRPILPCRGEWSDMMFISKILSKAKDGELVQLDERNLTKCHECGLLNTKENYDGYARNIQLFTLFQGTYKVRVYDWFCHVCRKTRRFSGYRYGIFPAQQNSAFTTELLYQWLEMTCFQGYSFRNAFQTTRSMQRVASMRMRHKNQLGDGGGDRSGPLNATFDIDNDGSHRRRANDALREFIRLLDTSSPMVAQNLFSCENCERPLSADDCAELGISREEGKRMKRLRAVVIDGTASGILTELPSFDRNNVTVPGPKSMSAIYKTQKLLKKHPHRKALRKLFKAVKNSFRVWKKGKEQQSPLSIPAEEDEPLRIWMRKSDNIPIEGIQDPVDTFTKSECRIVQLFLSEQVCFCPANDSGDPSVPQAVQSQHNNECKVLNKVFAKAKESDVIIKVVRILFSTRKGNAMKILDPTYETGDEDENVLENGQDSDEGQMDVHVLSPNSMPLIVNDESNDTAGQTTADEGIDDMEASDDEYEEDYDSYQAQKRQVTGVWATLELPGSENCPQFVESTLLLLEFLLTEHVALPYVGNGSHPHFDISELPSSTESNMFDFTEQSLKLHEELVCELEQYANPCTEACGSGNTTDCECRSRLKVSTLPICRVSPILGTFCQELIKLKKPLQPAYHRLLKSIIAVLKYHMEIARKFFKNMEKHCSAQCKSYWRSWADPDSNEQADEDQQNRLLGNAEAEEELKEAESSGICFPGRKRVRPCILFKCKNEEMCNKNYKTSKSHSPGLLTVQCSCDAPKLIGFVVMLQAESTAMALSAVLSHFKVFPRTVYYDNACNLFLSTMLRVPWVLGKTRFLVDRFHFKSHTCSSYFDPDAYAAFDADHTETAESINARIEKTLHQIRYLRGDHLVPFLRARFAFINLAATFRAMYHKDDLEDVDMTQFFQNTFHCSCIRCTDMLTVELDDD